MAEVDRIIFSYRDAAEALVKQYGIHEGVWMIYMEFGIKASNTGPSKEELYPTAIVPILKIGIQRIGKDHALADSGMAVDAAVVNPAPTPQRATGPVLPSSQSAASS